jgi:hypothetical protein
MKPNFTNSCLTLFGVLADFDAAVDDSSTTTFMSLSKEWCSFNKGRCRFLVVMDSLLCSLSVEVGFANFFFPYFFPAIPCHHKV